MLHILLRIAPLGIALSALVVVTLSLVLPAKTVVVYVDSGSHAGAGQRTFRHIPPATELLEIGRNAGATVIVDQCETTERKMPGAAWI